MTELRLHSVWPAKRPGDPDIGYAVDPARRRTALVVIPVCLVVGSLAMLLPSPFSTVVTFSMLGITIWLATRIGQGGFYELDAEGGLGAYLGATAPPDLRSRTRARAR